MNVSSQAGLMGNGDLPAYVATKHGVVGLSKSVSRYVSLSLLFLHLLNYCKGWVEICREGYQGQRALSGVSWSPKATIAIVCLTRD